jgi:hypothetical protein
MNPRHPDLNPALDADEHPATFHLAMGGSLGGVLASVVSTDLLTSKASHPC